MTILMRVIVIKFMEVSTADGCQLQYEINSMEQNSSSEADSRSAGQEIHLTLQDPKVN